MDYDDEINEDVFRNILNTFLVLEFDESNCHSFEYDDRQFDYIVQELNVTYARATFKNNVPVEDCIDLEPYSVNSMGFWDVSKINLNDFVRDIKLVISYLNENQHLYDEDGWQRWVPIDWDISKMINGPVKFEV